ncbi:MAG: HoxN/HupN/NixA family nickel/cobalt transporter [Betaproteobacteria bacterium]
MTDAIIYLATSFWIGAVHAATPGHGKTIAAAYIVGARGKPVDAVILGVFVTLSHTSGIVLVGVLASLGLPGMVPQRIEAWMALITGILVIGIGFWTLWTQRELMLQLQGVAPAPWHAHEHMHEPAHTHAEMRYRPHTHEGEHAHGHHHHRHDHAHPHHDAETGSHSHGWGFKHTHDMKLATTNRPSLWVLIGLGIAGGLLPDPAALAILLNALAQGKVMLGLGTVVVFSIGFAATLVVVGVVAAKVGQKILDWLAGPWAARMQISTSLLIVLVGVILSVKAWTTLSTFA